MLVTEIQAKEMRCPLGLNHDTPLVCGGAQCMAWRWADYKQSGAGEIVPWTGYCGLAGEPEPE